MKTRFLLVTVAACMAAFAGSLSARQAIANSDDVPPISPEAAAQISAGAAVSPFVPVDRGDYFKRYEQVLTTML